MSFRMEKKNNLSNMEIGDLKALKAEMNLGGRLETTEKFGIRIIFALLLTVIVFSGFSIYITNINENMKKKVDQSISDQEKEIAKINADKQVITEKKEECRFANRCPYATDKCRNQEPPLVVLENGHSYRCFKAREV